jgi:hypothetical protein
LLNISSIVRRTFKIDNVRILIVINTMTRAKRTVADNAAQSQRQAVEANTDSQVGRKQEWSRGIGAVPIIGPPADIIREGAGCPFFR